MNKKEHLSAGGIQFEANRKLGYYLLDNEIYYNKLQALLAASKNREPNFNLNNDRVKWVFNEAEFIQFPWHIEPEGSLQDWYCIRAQQLRDKYDYIRLELSGGSDSTTVVYSFLLNNIHLDEVVFRYPKQGERGVSGDPWDTASENTLSEWEFAAKPLLQWITTNYPDTKVTVHDYSEEMIQEQDTKDESWIFRTKTYLQPGHAHKFTNRGGLLEKSIDRDVKFAIIHGIDKPRVCIKDGKFFLYFTDVMANSTNPDVGGYTNVTNELFYWTPDCPEIVAKQCHELIRWFSLPEHHKFQHTLNWPNGSFATRTLYEQLVRSVIYPDFDPNTFQVVKPTNNIYNEMDYWFHVNFKDTKIYQVWESGVNYLLDNLDEKYIGYVRNRATNIKDYSTPFYYLGDSTIPDVGVFKTRELVRDFRNDQTKYIHCIRGKLSIY
jgi:hypothetical protein